MNETIIPSVRFPYPAETRALQFEMSARSQAEPIFHPVEGSNKRKARCARCKRIITAGAGHAWDFDSFGYAYVRFARKVYYCDCCHEFQLQMLDIQPEIDYYMARIEAWCDQYVTLSMASHARRWVARIVRKCELQGAEVARLVAERLPLLEDSSFGAVVNLARGIAIEICGGPVDGGA
jgi:hypothetical protein